MNPMRYWDKFVYSLSDDCDVSLTRTPSQVPHDNFVYSFPVISSFSTHPCNTCQGCTTSTSVNVSIISKTRKVQGVVIPCPCQTFLQRNVPFAMWLQSQRSTGVTACSYSSLSIRYDYRLWMQKLRPKSSVIIVNVFVGLGLFMLTHYDDNFFQ